MKGSKRQKRVKVSADGQGVVSHAGVGLLRETAERTGLVDGVSAALADTYQGQPIHAPGRVFTDLAVAIADGADAIAGSQVVRDRVELFGSVASDPTMWRVLDRIDEAHLPQVSAARAAARERVWSAGAAPAEDAPLTIDMDATITLAHSEKENAAATWKHTFGFHPLLAFLDRGEISGGEALAGLLRPGNAGSNTAADHVTVLEQALASLPPAYRPIPGADPTSPAGPGVLVRTDAAGATHTFAKACRERGVGFSFGFAVDARIRRLVDAIPGSCWHPALDADGGLRDGAWVTELTDSIGLTAWPTGTRLILRAERPHPGAQLNFLDADGHRITALITDTAPGVVPGQVAGLEQRHRQHARVEDRIREAKNTGLRNLPCRAHAENAAWLEAVLTAIDLSAWTQLLAFTDQPELARCEIATFRYRVLHVAARLVHTARRIELRLDRSWRWAQAIATGYHRLRTALS